MTSIDVPDTDDQVMSLGDRGRMIGTTRQPESFFSGD
jgi:hypothetical protein